MKIMKFCKAIALTAVTSLALMHAPARAATVDFGSYVSYSGGIDSGGFSFSDPFSVGVVNGSLADYDFGVRNNSPMLVFFSGGIAERVLTVSQTNGGRFSLGSLDVGRWYGLDIYNMSPNASLSITGYTGPGVMGAQIILEPFNLPELAPNDGYPLTSVTIPQQFASLSFQSMTFSLQGYAPGGYVAVDKLVLTPVPEPETYALLLAGLGLLAVIGRRRKTQG